MQPTRRDISRLDYAALTAPVDPVALKSFRAARAERARLRRSSGESVTQTLGAVAGFVAAASVAVFGGLIFVGVGSVFLMVVGVDTSRSVPVLIAVPVLAVLGVVAVVLARRRRAIVEEWRLDAFARANGLGFDAACETPARPGLIFGIGGSRTIVRGIRDESARFTEIANYRYTTGTGKERTVHRWGYAAVRMDVPLPHIVLDAVGNNGLFGSSNLPASFDRSQRLSLEGDFDQHFALYCPAGYERDALYLFTPDIMASFIDQAARFDVEIVDDWLFLYARNRDLVTVDPAALAAVFAVIDAVTARLEQWERWRDDRLPAERVAAASSPTPPAVTTPAPGAALEASAAHHPSADPAPAAGLLPVRAPGVASGGKRLRRGASWTSWVVGAVIVGYWIWTWLR